MQRNEICMILLPCVTNVFKNALYIHQIIKFEATYSGQPYDKHRNGQLYETIGKFLKFFSVVKIILARCYKA